MNLEVAVVQEARKNSSVRREARVWQPLLAIDGVPDFNAGSIQPEEAAIGVQAYQRVRGNAPEEAAAQVRRELSDGMSPTHHPARSAQPDIFFSENCPVIVLFSSLKFGAGIDVSRKRCVRGHDEIGAGRNYHGVSCISLRERTH